MYEEKFYLRDNIKSEPLINNWYAWFQLYAPATAAMLIANSHLKIMRSYIKSPKLHEIATKDPAMLGGPFIDYEVNKVDEMRALIEYTEQATAMQIQFSVALKELDQLLTEYAFGESLQPLYEKVPGILKGYVELVYDLNNNPSFRLMESLLYYSDIYNDALQSVTLSEINDDHRAFCLSTPRIKNSSQVNLKIPFSNSKLDVLYRSKQQGLTRGELLTLFEDLNGLDEDREKFLSFFSKIPTKKQLLKKDYGATSIRYLGHACLLIEAGDVVILVDPVISYDYETGIERYSYKDLPDKIDYIVITHGHQDHVLLEHLLQLRHKTECVVVPNNNNGALQDPSLKLFFQKFGYQKVIELSEMDSIHFPGGKITGLPFLGEHSDLNIQTKMVHLIELGGKKILCAADSNNMEPQLYAHIKEIVGDIDVLFLGMECAGAPLTWLYGPLLTRSITRQMDQSRRLNGSDYKAAMALIEQFNCQFVYIYAMGQEPWLGYIMSVAYKENSRPIIESDRVIAERREKGLHAERLFGKKEITL